MTSRLMLSAWSFGALYPLMSPPGLGNCIEGSVGGAGEAVCAMAAPATSNRAAAAQARLEIRILKSSPKSEGAVVAGRNSLRKRSGVQLRDKSCALRRLGTHSLFESLRAL